MGFLSCFLAVGLLLTAFAGCRRQEALPAAHDKARFAAIENLYLSHLDSSIAALASMGRVFDSLAKAGRGPIAADAGHLRDLYLAAKGSFKSAEPVLAYAEKEVPSHFEWVIP
jgi:hypothetical protein